MVSMSYENSCNYRIKIMHAVILLNHFSAMNKYVILIKFYLKYFRNSQAFFKIVISKYRNI